MNYTRKIAVLLALLWALTWSATLSAQELITIGEPLEAELSAGEFAQYRFQATEGTRYSISVASDAFDTFLFLRDADEVELTRNDDGGEDTNSLIRVFTAPADGTYTVEVRGFNATDSGPFTLAVTEVDLQLLEPDEAISASFGEQQEFLFGLEAEGGSVLDVILQSGNLLDVRLSLLNPEEVVIAENDATGTADPALTDVLVETPGLHYILIERSNPELTLSGDFSLVVQPSGVPSLDDESVTVSLDGFDSTQEILTFSGAEGEAVLLRVVVEESTPGVTPIFELLQNNEVFANFVLSGLEEVQVAATVPADGEVTLRIRAFNAITMQISREEVEE
ncbi:MAG: hypothetical protein OHK0046_12230 [Anaerolineae bacterium]